MTKLRIVDGMIVVADGDEIVGCVTRCNDSQWQFVALKAPNDRRTDFKFLPLHYALREALQFDFTE